MKKISILLLMLISLSAFSQQRDMGRMERAKIAQLSSEEKAEIFSKRMALQLDLTKAQRAEIKKLHLEQLNERQALKAESQKTAREKATKRYARINRNLDKRLAQQEKMKEILNEEQYKKWKESVKQTNRKNKSLKKRTI